MQGWHGIRGADRPRIYCLCRTLRDYWSDNMRVTLRGLIECLLAAGELSYAVCKKGKSDNEARGYV